MYENQEVTITWDIPEYSGYEISDNTRPPRPDGKIILHKEKKIFVLENSIPWVQNRETKYEEKELKYQGIIQSLRIDYPSYEVRQLTFIMDCLGGFSVSLRNNIRKLGFTVEESKVITYGMQKIIVSEASSLIDMFKIITARNK